MESEIENKGTEKIPAKDREQIGTNLEEGSDFEKKKMKIRLLNEL